MRSRTWSLRRRPIKITFPAFHSTEPLHLSLSPPFSSGSFTSQSAEEHDRFRRMTPNHALQRSPTSNSWSRSPGECWLGKVFLEGFDAVAALFQRGDAEGRCFGAAQCGHNGRVGINSSG